MSSNYIKYLKPKLVLGFFVTLIVAALPLMAVLPASAAVNAGFSLSPASKTITVGDSMVVYLNLDTGGNSVLAWKATINYSTYAFSSVSVETDPSSHFTQNPATDIASGGTIKIARFATSASSTDGAMAKITLRSTGVGSTALSFAHICNSTSDATPCSAVTNSSGTNLLANLTGGSYTVSAVPVAASGGKTAKKKSLFSRVADAVAGVVSPSTSAEEVGADTSSARGTVKLTVVDKKSVAIKGAKVTLAGKTGVTNIDGQALLKDLKSGLTEGTVVYDGKTQKIEVLIQPGTSASNPQTIVVNFNVGGSIIPKLLMVLVGLIVVGLLIDLVFGSKGGFKSNVDKLIHHGGDHSPVAGVSSTTKYSEAKPQTRHDALTPGLIIEPNSRGEHHEWKY